MAKTEGMDKLKDLSQDLLRNLGDKALDSVHDRLSGLSEKLTDLGEGSPGGKAAAKAGEAAAEGDSPLLGGLKGAASGLKDKITGGGGGGGGGGGSKATKSTNIIETIDVGVPLKVAYNQWTEFGAFPSFMKKVESVEAPEENKITFKAQIFLSHRTWEATIIEQIPDERIIWRSKGKKGHVDGAVTFHEIGHNLTRILVVLEYYPQGLFEKTGNIWEAQGRRARAEVRHFRRHVMTRTILDPDEVEGWRGTIEDSEVVETHEEALEREEQEAQESEEQESEEQESDDGYDSDDDDSAEDEEPEDAEEPEDEYDDEESEDEEPEDEPEDELEEDYEENPGDEDELVDEEEDEETTEDDEAEDDEDEEDEEDEEEARPRSRRRRAS